MRFSLTAAICAGALAVLTACQPSTSVHPTPTENRPSPVPYTAAQWYDHYSVLFNIYEAELQELDAAVAKHDMSLVQSYLKMITETKNTDTDISLDHPISDMHSQNIFTSFLFDVDDLVQSYQSNVVDDDFAAVSDAQKTEASFRQSLHDFQSSIKKAAGR
jgi:hypothetical protein